MGGGCRIDLTRVTSAGFNVSRAFIAASSAGVASDRSLSHSSLIDWEAAAASLASASSAAIIYNYYQRMGILFEIYPILTCSRIAICFQNYLFLCFYFICILFNFHHQTFSF